MCLFRTTINNLCSLIIFINILKYVNVTGLPLFNFIYSTKSLTNTAQLNSLNFGCKFVHRLETWLSGTADMNSLNFLVFQGSQGRLSELGCVGKNHGVHTLPKSVEIVELFVKICSKARIQLRSFSTRIYSR